MEKTIVGLSGYARSGKDTVGEYLEKAHGFRRISFAAALKDMAYILNPIVAVGDTDVIRLSEAVDKFGWEQAKTNPEIRRTLQILGTECVRYIVGENVWVDIVDKTIQHDPYDKWVVTDCRFPNELAYVKDQGLSCWITRPDVGPINDHQSEHTIRPEDSDYILSNHGSVEDLYSRVDEFVKGLI